MGRYEIPANEILETLKIPHIDYSISTSDEVDSYLTSDRKEWIEGVGEVIVNSKLFTTEETSMVTFEEFAIFCRHLGISNG